MKESTYILSESELEDLTGAKRSEGQIRVLVNHGIKFVTRSDGKIRTTWDAVNSVLSQKAKNEEQEPNLDFLRHG